MAGNLNLNQFALAKQPQRRIGLTGGIASGKSSAGKLLQEKHRLAVLDADRYAREALAPGTTASQAVLNRYGKKVFCGDHLDRKALGEIVFNNPNERLWLEQLVHPVVNQMMDQEIIKLSDAKTIVLMIPLLFETGLESLCTEIWLVDCDEKQQIERLITRDNCTNQQALARINAQWPLARKRLLADRVINNRNGSDELEIEVAVALNHLAV
ncbi:dephospho-CoA kinase [Synechococcus sp. Cruz CV12-2-Slac-r]|uniref:dephospho-CoA kinase n=1 Tax=Synechococcus sp. Cruz CV12-2-Slac-r TaxID=2823748 RepID=UPI0020CFD209|nr:dephospho-CoA kinase [Synechococcus sp. Cruz CV12-2-Slac-r]